MTVTSKANTDVELFKDCALVDYAVTWTNQYLYALSQEQTSPIYAKIQDIASISCTSAAALCGFCPMIMGLTSVGTLTRSSNKNGYFEIYSESG